MRQKMCIGQPDEATAKFLRRKAVRGYSLMSGPRGNLSMGILTL